MPLKPAEERRPTPATKAHAVPPAPIPELERVSQRLVKGAGIIREEWKKVEGGADRTTLDKALLLWLELMWGYYHSGGTGCAMSLAGGKCSQRWDPMPLCWHCAGGEGMPPERRQDEKSQTPTGDAGGPSTTPGGGDAEVQAADAAGHRRAPVAPEIPSRREGAQARSRGDEELAGVIHCTREGCTITDFHVHISSVGYCRRKVAYSLLGYEPTDPPHEHWKNAASMGGLGERIVVDYLRRKGYTLTNTLEDQVEVCFVSAPGLVTQAVVYTGHPDGDIAHEGGMRNLEIKCPNDEKWQLFRDQGVRFAFLEYAAQAEGYMKAKKEDATLFAVMSRDSGRIHEEEYRKEDGLWENLDHGWHEVRALVMRGELPEPDRSGDEYACFVCEYRSGCPAWRAKQ